MFLSSSLLGFKQLVSTAPPDNNMRPFVRVIIFIAIVYSNRVYSSSVRTANQLKLAIEDGLISDISLQNNISLSGGVAWPDSGCEVNRDKSIVGDKLSCGGLCKIDIAASDEFARRFLYVSKGGEINIRDVNIIGGYLKGLTEHTIGGSVGGAIYLNRANGHFENCIFQGNEAASGWGGAVHAHCSTVRFQSCTFTGNTAVHGGAVQTRGERIDGTSIRSDLTFASCHFERNAAGGWGGAVQVGYKADISFESCTFTENLATDKGGAVHLTYGTGIFSEHTFTDNAAREGDITFLDHGAQAGFHPYSEDLWVATSGSNAYEFLPPPPPPTTAPTYSSPPPLSVGEGSQSGGSGASPEMRELDGDYAVEGEDGGGGGGEGLELNITYVIVPAVLALLCVALIAVWRLRRSNQTVKELPKPGENTKPYDPHKEKKKSQKKQPPRKLTTGFAGAPVNWSQTDKPAPEEDPLGLDKVRLDVHGEELRSRADSSLPPSLHQEGQPSSLMMDPNVLNKSPTSSKINLPPPPKLDSPPSLAPIRAPPHLRASGTAALGKAPPRRLDPLSHSQDSEGDDREDLDEAMRYSAQYNGKTAAEIAANPDYWSELAAGRGGENFAGGKDQLKWLSGPWGPGVARASRGPKPSTAAGGSGTAGASSFQGGSEEQEVL